MSQVITQPQMEEHKRFIDRLHDVEDEGNWEREIDHRKVKDAADLQMLKN